MCFPPFCAPATHFLGCFSLRIGAGVVLVLNAGYGLSLIVVHALLLGEDKDIASAAATTTPTALGAAPSPTTTPVAEEVDSGWHLQLMDLDISWGHELLRFDDYSCLLCGLIYGVIIVVLSGLMFHATMSHASYLAVAARWFVAFMHLEMIMFVGLMMAKLSKVCSIQEVYMPKLEMNCDVLQFLYLERCAVMLVAAGVCSWVFASMTYLLTFGNQPVDRADFAQHLDMPSRDALHDAEMASRDALVPRGLQPGEGPSIRMPIGEPLRTGFQGSMRSMSAAASPQRTSYHIPRAVSHASSATRGSNHGTGISHSLVRPPVAIY